MISTLSTERGNSEIVCQNNGGECLRRVDEIYDRFQ